MPLIALCLTTLWMPSPIATAGQPRGGLVRLGLESGVACPGGRMVCDSDLRVCTGFPYVSSRRGNKRPRTGFTALEFDIRNPARELREFEAWPVGFPKRRGWLSLNYAMCWNYDHGSEAMAAAVRDLRLGRPAWGTPPLWSVVFTGHDPPIPSTADPE